MAYPSIAKEDTSQADENGCSMITADVQNRSSLMVSVLTCSFSQQDLCAQFSSFARYSMPLDICKHMPSKCVCTCETCRTVCSDTHWVSTIMWIL